MFLVTECNEHGTKVTTDNGSARVYRDMARDCVEDVTNDPHGHWMAHRVQGSDCWTCCDKMRIARDWEQAD
jgi:hypothetical protein